jgi:hypothetical protein
MDSGYSSDLERRAEYTKAEELKVLITLSLYVSLYPLSLYHSVYEGAHGALPTF